MEDKFAAAKAKLREAHYMGYLYLKAYRAAYATFAPGDNGFVHVSCIGRRDFPDHVKDNLRELNRKTQELSKLAYGLFPPRTHNTTKWKIDNDIHKEVMSINSVQ